MNNNKQKEFIPARESVFFIWFFKWYTWFLMKRRFRSVYIRNSYDNNNRNSTLYICNHHYWWDGLTPLLLNEFLFHQKARAVMEDKQMRAFPFFSRIGAFSINRSNPKSALKSLKYGSDWLKTENSCLFLYPEGKFSQPHESISIEPGLSKLIEWTPESDLVNISMYITYQNSDKPELFIDISAPIPHPVNLSKTEFVSEFNQLMNTKLDQLRRDCKSELDSFRKLL